MVSPERSSVIVPALDRGQIEEAPRRVTPISYGAESDGIPELAAALGGARTVGVEEDHLIYARARALGERGFDLIPAGSVVMGLRVQKDPGEIERNEIRGAAIGWVIDRRLRRTRLAEGRRQAGVPAGAAARRSRSGDPGGAVANWYSKGRTAKPLGSTACLNRLARRDRVQEPVLPEADLI